MLRSIAVGAAALFVLSINFVSVAQTVSASNHKPPPGVAATAPQVQAPLTAVTDHNGIIVASKGCTSAKSHSGKGASIFDTGSGGVLTSYKNASRSQPCGKGKGQMDDANSALGDVSTTR